MTNFWTLMRNPENRVTRNYFLLGVAGLLIIGGLSLSLIQSHAAETHARADTKAAKAAATQSALAATQAQTAADQAQAALKVANKTLDCLNKVLAERSTTTAADNKAQIAAANAVKADATSFQVLLQDILVTAPASKSTPDFLRYFKIHENLVKVETATAATLTSSQDKRDAHPLGAC